MAKRKRSMNKGNSRAWLAANRLSEATGAGVNDARSFLSAHKDLRDLVAALDSSTPVPSHVVSAFDGWNVGAEGSASTGDLEDLLVSLKDVVRRFGAERVHHGVDLFCQLTADVSAAASEKQRSPKRY